MSLKAEDITVKEVEVTFGGTIPTQPYGNVMVNCRWVAEVKDGQTAQEVTDVLFNQIRNQIMDAVKPIVAAKTRQVKQALEYLPEQQRKPVEEKIRALDWFLSVAPEAAFNAQETPKVAPNPETESQSKEEVINAH